MVDSTIEATGGSVDTAGTMRVRSRGQAPAGPPAAPSPPLAGPSGVVRPTPSVGHRHAVAPPSTSPAARTPLVSAPAAVGSRRAARDVAVQIVGRLFNLGLGVVVTVLVARTLGQAGFGQWSTIFVIVQIAQYFTDLGLEQVTVREIVRERGAESRWIAALTGLRAIIAVPVALGCAGAILLIVNGGTASTAGLVISASLLLSAPGAVKVIFQLRVRNDLAVAVMTLNSILWTGAVIAIAASHRGMVLLAVAFVVAMVLSVSAQLVIALRFAKLRFAGARRLWPELLRVGVPVAVGGLLITGYARIDQVLVYKLAGDREAGLYAAAYRLLDQSQFLPIAVVTTLFPLIAAAHLDDPERMRRLVTRAAEYLAMGSLGALAVALALADPIVRALFGADFAPAAPALPILMGAFVGICFGYLNGQLVVVLGLQRTFVVYAGIALAVNVVLNLLLVPRYGFLAAAWVTVATEVVVLALTGRRVLRELAFRPPVGRLVRTLAAATLLAGGLWGAREAGAPLAAGLALAVVVYPALLLAAGALRVQELLSLLRRDPL